MSRRFLIMAILVLLSVNLLFSQKNGEGEAAKVIQDVNLYDYIPFREHSKLAVLNRESSLKLTDNLPLLDGATAFYPVYAAFVQAVYPSAHYKTPYEILVRCMQTPQAYENLIDGEVDIIFCFEPSQAQIAAAAEKGIDGSKTVSYTILFTYISMLIVFGIIPTVRGSQKVICHHFCKEGCCDEKPAK